jgi:flagellar biosynthetic protein FliQ
MQYEQFMLIGRETLVSVLLAIAPCLGAALVAGLIVSIFQAATSINEQTLAFVPKLLVVLVVLALAGPFMITTLSEYFLTVFSEIARVNR